MAFQTKQWQARQGVGLNKFSINGEAPVTLVNIPDKVIVGGDAFSEENMNDLERRIDDSFKGKTYSFTASNWLGAEAPYSINLPNSTHNLGSTVKVDYFNDNSDVFEWVKDAAGNITIFSNVRIAIKVNLK